MNESELRKHATCALCRKKILHVGLPLFWRVTVERFGVDVRSMRRLDSLGTMLGSQALASVMGPDDTLAKPMMDPVVLAVCEDCATASDLPVAALAEHGR